jgi:hypothetical protein
VQKESKTITFADDIIILAFLRAKKYSMDRVYKSYEKSVMYLKSNPFYNELNEEKGELQSFLERLRMFSGVLKHRDAEGRRVVVANAKGAQSLKMSINEAVKIMATVITAIITEEETQIAGLVMVVDFRDVSMAYFKTIKVDELFQLVSSLESLPVRIKQIHIIGLPRFAVATYHLVHNLLSEKIRNRISLMTDLNELPKFMDTSMLLNANCDAFNTENFLDLDDKIKWAFQMNESIAVDFDKVQKFESVGSFRKLDFD